jgi:chromosome partitioning protein
MSKRGIIIAFAGQKGGSGKSTVAENVAVGLSLQGADTVIVDCDVDQQTSSKWVSRRNEAIDEGKSLKQIHISLQSDNIKQGVLDAAGRYDAVVMDVAGRDGRALRTALIVADLIYIPVRPSQHDLETLDHVYELLTDTEDLNPKRTVRTLLTMCPTHVLITERTDAEEFLTNFKNQMPLSDAMISDRKAYRDASLAGEGVLEGQNQKAKEEIMSLMKEVMKHV